MVFLPRKLQILVLKVTSTFQGGRSKMVLLKFAKIIPTYEYRIEKVQEDISKQGEDEKTAILSQLEIQTTVFLKSGGKLTYLEISQLTPYELGILGKCQDRIDRKRAFYWGLATLEDKDRELVLKNPEEYHEENVELALKCVNREILNGFDPNS